MATARVGITEQGPIIAPAMGIGHAIGPMHFSNATPRGDPAWRGEGWHPLLASKAYSAEDRLQITGDLGEQFQELYLPSGEGLDVHSPIFVRAQPGKPDMFDVTILRSDHFGVHHRKAIAFAKRIAPLGEDTILQAASDDAGANCAVGRYILWELDDPLSARPYLERAAAGGIADALLDLAIINSAPPGLSRQRRPGCAVQCTDGAASRRARAAAPGVVVQRGVYIEEPVRPPPRAIWPVAGAVGG
jgi:hypothetical protein